MLIDTCVTIAYKCTSCGTFEFFYISLFELSNKKECKLTCRCGKSSLLIREENYGDYKIRIPCISCGDEHIFTAGRKELLCRNINIFYCPVTGMQQCYVGNDSDVRVKVDALEKELDELIDLFGYDSYFKNTRVMIDTLNRIHDIAEQGNLYCECGNEDIELILLQDKVCLQCKNCSGNKTIYAVNNEDLKDILRRKRVMLVNELPGCDASAPDTLMRKSDGKIIR